MPAERNTQPATTQIRSVIPTCLQHRAPANYEILNSSGRRLTPTLAGYRLYPGREYRVRVQTQDASPQGWRLDVMPSPAFVEWRSDQALDGAARTLTLHTRFYMLTDALSVLRRVAADMTVRLTFEDGRRPYDLHIPVVLAAIWIYLPALILIPVGSYLSQRDASWQWRGLVGLAALLVTVFLCISWSLWRTWRAAKRIQAAARAELARVETTAIS